MFQYQPRKKTIEAQVVEIADQPNVATIAWLKTTEGRLLAVRHKPDVLTHDEFLVAYAPGNVVEVMAGGFGKHPPRKR